MPRVHRTLPAGSRSSTATPSDPVCAHPARAQRRGPALRARATRASAERGAKTDRTRHRLRDETLGVSAHDASRADLCCAPTAGKTDTEAAQAGGGVGGLLPGTLPPGWEERFSSSRQRVYYYQKKTGNSTWEHPTTLQGAEEETCSGGSNELGAENSEPPITLQGFADELASLTARVQQIVDERRAKNSEPPTKEDK